MSSSIKLNCLIVLPSCKEGVSAQSFINCFSMTHNAFNVQIATPGGRPPEFISLDEQSRRWLNDFNTKSFSVPINLEVIDAQRYSCIIIPHCPGAVYDLAANPVLGQILAHFIKEQKLICAVGLGVAALLSAHSDLSNGTENKEKKLGDHQISSWLFKNYSLTGLLECGIGKTGKKVEQRVESATLKPNSEVILQLQSTVYELACAADFSALPVIVEDEVRDLGGSFSASGEAGSVHVILDRHLVTGQNEASTLTAVQNLVLQANQRQGKPTGK